MQHRSPAQNTLFVFAVLSLWSGCSEWPRYAHPTAINDDALVAGSDPADGIDISFGDPTQEVEPNDTPGEPIAIAQRSGWVIEGDLIGLGWDPEAPSTLISECGDPRAFPPASPGNYTGDVDWISLAPEEAGSLCVDLVSSTLDTRVDLTLYKLDDCNEPVQVFVQGEDATPIGIDSPGTHVRWAIAVDESPLGLALAGFWPVGSDASMDWSIEVALVPSTADVPPETLCPWENSE